MPMGVPMITAPLVMIRLPTIALANPPFSPGGGVDSVKRCGPRAETPLTRRFSRMKASQIRPKIAALTERMMKIMLVSRRRK